MATRKPAAVKVPGRRDRIFMAEFAFVQVICYLCPNVTTIGPFGGPTHSLWEWSTT
jgi:hypothetical protein